MDLSIPCRSRRRCASERRLSDGDSPVTSNHRLRGSTSWKHRTAQPSAFEPAGHRSRRGGRHR